MISKPSGEGCEALPVVIVSAAWRRLMLRCMSSRVVSAARRVRGRVGTGRHPTGSEAELRPFSLSGLQDAVFLFDVS